LIIQKRYVFNFRCPLTFAYCLLLHSCNGNDAILASLCSWNGRAPSAGNIKCYRSRFAAAKQSGPNPGWLPTLGTDAKTCVQDTHPRHQRLEAASHWHTSRHIMKLIEKAVGQWKKRLRPSVKAKARHFEHLLDKKMANCRATTVYNRLFLESQWQSNGLPAETRYVTYQFRRNYI